MNDYDLWFILLNIGAKIKINLLEKFKDTKEIWYYVLKACEYKKINEPKININDKRIDYIKNSMQKNNISVVTYKDEDYPKALRNYEYAPCALFYKGNIKTLSKITCVSIVGSRKCSQYGIDAAKAISGELTRHNIGIVSGLAKGIDSCGHIACLENNGYTCAVLGSGLDVIYPRENAKLFSDIIESGGCIVSQFVPGTKPLGNNFKVRNQIISALSSMTIVVEAALRSGSLITASSAASQGKEVMAVPGSIFSKTSEGTNKLIQDHVASITCFKDIFDKLGIDYNKSIKIGYDTSKLSGLELKIYNLISDNPIHIDDIVKSIGVDITQIYGLLFEMQLKKEIMCLNGSYYVKINNAV